MRSMFRGVYISWNCHFGGFCIFRFMDAEASSVEIFVGETFTDVQICIVQCILHWCSWLCLPTPMLGVSDCHKRYNVLLSFLQSHRLAQICSMTCCAYSKEWIVTSMLSMLFW